MSYEQQAAAIECYQQQADNERYANILAALKECLERGVSSTSMATLRFETGVDLKDYLLIQDGVIAKFNSEIGELDV
jgi:hypothetical protein